MRGIPIQKGSYAYNTSFRYPAQKNPGCHGRGSMRHDSTCEHEEIRRKLCILTPSHSLRDCRFEAHSRGNADTYSRDCNMSFLASPSLRYDRSTEIDVRCPCGSSPGAMSSSLVHVPQTRQEKTRVRHAHFCQYITNDAPLGVFSYVGEGRPGHSMV